VASADGLETRRWNGTKSAFADYATAAARRAAIDVNVMAALRHGSCYASR
jgi:hypothetical protein